MLNTNRRERPFHVERPREDRPVTAANASVFQRAVRWQAVEAAVQAVNAAAAAAPELCRFSTALEETRSAFSRLPLDAVGLPDAWRAHGRAQEELVEAARAVAATASLVKAVDDALLAYREICTLPALDRPLTVGGLG